MPVTATTETAVTATTETAVTATTETAVTATTETAPQPLAGDLCWLLSRASHVLMTEQTAALEGSGISPREHAVLVTAMSGSYTQTELARLIGLDKTTMVVTVDDLEATGLAVRQASPTDRRARVIAVTEEGRRRVREAETILERVRDDVLAALPADEQQALLRALGRLVCGRLAEPVQCSHQVRRPRQ